MSPNPPARRISYVIPPPAQSVPRLVLPRLGADRHGSTTPLLVFTSPEGDATVSVAGPDQQYSHPRHRLGISSFALDTSTRLSGKTSPEGILYSGGRDGQVIAHELGAALKHRSKPYGINPERKAVGKSWEAITGWREIEGYGEDEQDASSTPDIPYENAWEIDSSPGEPSLKPSFRQSVQSHSDWINDILLCNFNRTLVSCSSDGTVRAWSPHDPASAMEPVVVGRHSDYVRCLTRARHQKWVASGAFDRTIKLWDLSNKRQEPTLTLSPPEVTNAKASIYALATDAAGSFIASGSPERVIRIWDPRSGKRTGKLVGHTDNIRSILVSDDGRYLLTGSADASIKLWSMAAANRCIHTFAHHTESVWSMYSSHPTLSIFYSGDRSGNVCRVDVDGSASLSEGECVLLCKEAPCTDGIGNEGINSLKVLDDKFVFTATASSTINCWRVPASRRTRIAEGAGAETEHGTPSAAPLAGSSVPFGFSLDSMQPSLLRSRQRDSFSADKEGWTCSESPSSMDPPVRRVESPSRTSPRNISKHLSTVSVEHAASQNPSNSSIHTALGNSPPTSNPGLFGVAYQSLIKLSSPTDGWVSPLFPRVKDSDAATLYSAASIKSVPVPIHQLTLRGQSEAMRSPIQPQPAINTVLTRSMASFDAGTPGTISGSRFVTSPPEETEEAARLEYESRDVAVDAIPVRSRPDHVIQGTQGIVRSVVLNDRWHALTVDTMGHVGVWDIVRGLCIGMYQKQDVEQAIRIENSRAPQDDEWKWSPREALDIVRDRIEGEAVVHAWCTVDTSIGNLMVHITSTQAFDAEIFADEAGYHGEFKFEEDHRLNIGKWILGNLFAPFVARQKIIQSEPDYFPDTTTSEPLQLPPGLAKSSISRQGGPRHINLEARKVRSIAEIIPSHRTPGRAASPASIPMTPALLPDLPPDALEKVAAANAATSPSSKLGDHGHTAEHIKAHTPLGSMASTTPRARRSATLDDSTPPSLNLDYFTVKRRASLGKEEHGETTTGGPLVNIQSEANAPSEADASTTLNTVAPQQLPLATPSTPGAALTTPGSVSHASTPFGFMGKLKALGKQKKAGASDTTEAQSASAASAAADAEKAAKAKTPTPTLLQTIMSKPLSLPDFSDVPPIDINSMTGIVISQVASEAASGWTPVYRGLYSTQAEDEDIAILEHELPGWVLEFLLANTVDGVVSGGGPNSAQKFSFMVVPWRGTESSEDLPELLSNQSRLTASRWLRVRKILSYVKDKVDAIEQAERRKDAELLMSENGSPSGPGIPRPPSSKSVKSTTRSSQDISPGSPRPAAGRVLNPSPPQSSSQAPRVRPTSTSSNRSAGSGPHHTRHRKASRGNMEEMQVEKRPEDLYELMCHDMLLPNEITLAAVKKFKWKGGGELVMEYRRKKTQAPAPAPAQAQA